MNGPAIDELATRCLLGLADDTECADLSDQLAGSSEARERFIEHVSLHAALIREAKAGALAENSSVFFEAMEKVEIPPARKKRFWLPAAAAAVAASTVRRLAPNRSSSQLASSPA